VGVRLVSLRIYIGSRWSVAYPWKKMADSVKSPSGKGNHELNTQKSQRHFHGGFFVRDTLTRSIFLCPESIYRQLLIYQSFI
jgi:hypothetical protein